MQFTVASSSVGYICSIAVAIALALVTSAQDRADARVATPGVEQVVLIDAPLAQFPSKHIRVFTGHFEPGARTSLHRHPGTELLYVLEGRGTMILPGRPSEALIPGKMLLVEPDVGQESFTHQAVNLSETEEMKTLVIVIHDEGTPSMIPIEDVEE